MAVYDDKTLGIIKAGDRDNCFIISNIKSRTEAVFKASYIVASSMRVSGKITALFDLIVLGDVEADDIEVKGKFICLGNCTAENSIIVQDKMFVKQVKAKNIEVHDQITAQEIDVDVIKTDGNIIVSQTLATESVAFSGQNILCGETAYGAGKISANSIITVEELDMDDRLEAVVAPNKIIFKSAKTETLADISAKYSALNDYESYLCFLLEKRGNKFQKTAERWESILRQIDNLFKAKKFICYDIGLLLILTEIKNSSYFKNWAIIEKWWSYLNEYFNKIVNCEKVENHKPLSISDLTFEKRVVHNIYGPGIVLGVRRAADTFIDVLFDSGKKISFQLDLALKFFRLEKKFQGEEIKEKLFLEPKGFNEWISYLKIIETHRHAFDTNLIKIINHLLYAKIGLKYKFIEDRIRDNGWN